MKNEIFWKNPGYTIRPNLQKDIECDYLIVGGGMTGVSTAYILAKSGAKNIVLVEKNHIGGGATGKAAGLFLLRGEVDLEDMIKAHGRKKAVAHWKKIQAGLLMIKSVIDEEKIDCDVELEDTLICGYKGENWSDLSREYKAEKSIDDTTKLLLGEDLRKELNSNLFTHGLLSKGHALSLNPLKFIQGFSQVAERYGVSIYENTAVNKTEENTALTERGSIRYKKIIWAIDVDYTIKNIKNLKTTVIVTRPLLLEELTKIGFGERKKVVWDTKKNEIYFNVTKDMRLLLGFGGIVVKKNQRKIDPYFYHLKQLKNFTKKLFPYLDLEIEYSWSGHFGVNKHYTLDPFIRYEKNRAVIGGAGSQVNCFLSALQITKKLLRK